MSCEWRFPSGQRTPLTWLTTNEGIETEEREDDYRKEPQRPLRFLSDFSFHTICAILGRARKLMVLDQFVTDLFARGQVTLLSAPAADSKTVTTAMQSQQLDFDDAYQYAIAWRHG